jgi:hypothetical protein
MGLHHATLGQRVIHALVSLATGALALSIICGFFAYLKLRHII